MKTNVNFSDFCDAFNGHGRENQFTYEGKRALFDYLEELEADMVEDIELDVIALCCEYTEYKDLAEFQADYSGNYETIDDIRDDTTVIMVDDDAFIIAQF